MANCVFGFLSHVTCEPKHGGRGSFVAAIEMGALLKMIFHHRIPNINHERLGMPTFSLMMRTKCSWKASHFMWLWYVFLGMMMMMMFSC